MKGEYDQVLTWPFECDITIQLLNWREDKGHVKKTIHFDKASRVRDRVMEGDTAPGWGIGQFIPHDDLFHNTTNNTEYVNNDIVCFGKFLKLLYIPNKVLFNFVLLLSNNYL